MTYSVFYNKNNVRYINIVTTNDIFHDIGKLVCDSDTAITSIRYIPIIGDATEYIPIWKQNGYIEIDSNTFIMCK